MNAWPAYIRGLHILCGAAALLVAPAAMLTAKGRQAHRRWGKIYLCAMTGLAVSAMLMTLFRPVLFLALVAVFSFYFAFRGYRSVKRKNQRPSFFDWAAAAIAFAGSLGLVLLGVHSPKAGFLPAPLVAVAFGLFGVAISGVDLYRFNRPPRDPRTWWYSHMGGMLGSYIAVVTAFSVVNFHFLPVALRWLWPSAVGIPGIFLWVSYYQKQSDKTSNRVVTEDEKAAE
jgi:uncharacterized membrane protein